MHIVYCLKDGIPKYIESQVESVMHVNPKIGKCTLFYNIVRIIILSSPKKQTSVLTVQMLFSLFMYFAPIDDKNIRTRRLMMFERCE